MSKAIAEIVTGAALIALDIILPEFVPLTYAWASTLASAGASLIMGGIGSLLAKQQGGLAVNTRNPIFPWNVLYGRGKVGGDVAFLLTTGESDEYLHQVYVLACHPCQSVDAVTFDGKRVCLDTSGNSLSFDDSTAVIASQQTVNISTIQRVGELVTVTLASAIPLPASTAAGPAVMDGDTLLIQNVTTDPTLNGLYRVQVLGPTTLCYTCGGSNVTISGQGQVVTTWPDYGDTVHLEIALGNQSPSSPPFPGLLAGGDTGSQGFWTSQHLLQGRTAAYLRMKYGGNTYASGMPTISFLLHGKNNIYDPRTSTYGYTENSALCIADFLCQSVWGFKCNMGTDVPTAPLIIAANICDESVPLANGSTEPRYACNGGFRLDAKRGEILQNMLTSCGGRITYAGGQYIIWPAYWPGIAATLGEKPMVSAVLSIISSYNPGTVVSNADGHTIENPAATIIPWDSSNWTGSQSTWLYGSGGSGFIYDLATTGLATTNIQLIPGQTGYNAGSQISVYSTEQSYDSSSLSALLSSLHVNAAVFGTAASSGSGVAFEIYEVWLTVTFSDSSTITYRPQNANVIAGGDSGATTVTNAGNAIDGNNSTAATLSGTSFGSVSPASLQLSDWAAASTTEGAPDLTDTSKLALANAAGPFQWKPYLQGRNLYNGVKGTYVSPLNGWNAADFPPYAQDPDHGYVSDANLAADGGDRRWYDVQWPFTISNPCSQRLAKIELLRRRQQGSGTFVFNLAVYGLTALDVVEYTLPILGWANKLLEITNFRFTNSREDGGESGALRLGCEMDLNETSPTVYEWSTSEELNATGGQAGTGVGTSSPTVAAPTGVEVVSGASVANGSQSQLYVTWTPSTDPYVQNGGATLIQYQVVGAAGWTALGSFAPSTSAAFISSVTNGQSYLVEVAFVDSTGIQSAWTEAGPVVASGGGSSPIGVNGNPTVEVNGVAASYDDIVYVNGSLAGTIASSGGSSSSPGSGSSGATGLTLGQQIAADMAGTNEAHPQGVPSSYDFYNGPVVEMGNDPDFTNGQVGYALEWWGGLYFGPSGNPSTNTQANVRNMTLAWVSKSTGAWTSQVFTAADISSDFFSDDFTTDYSTSVPMTTQTDGSIAFTTVSGEVAHFYAPYPRMAINPADIGGIIAYCEARLLLINPSGTDDRASAQLLLDCGADYYPTATGAGIENNPGVGVGKFKFIGKTSAGVYNNGWRSFAMTTMTQAEIDANPPPINISGILP